MSWLTNRRVRRMTDPVQGTMTLSGVSAAPTLGVRVQSFAFVGVVQAPGLPATAVEVSGLAAPAGKWPQPGFTLPVIVDRADPQRVVIQWDDVTGNNERALTQANNAAFTMQTGIDLDVLGRAVAGEGANDSAPPDAPDAPHPARNPA